MDCSLPGSSVHGILQSRILEWVAISFSRESSWSGDQTYVSCIAGRLFTNLARREALIILVGKLLRCESAVGKEKDSRCPPRRYWGFSEVDTCHRMSVRWTHDVYLLCHWHWSPCACLRENSMLCLRCFLSLKNRCVLCNTDPKHAKYNPHYCIGGPADWTAVSMVWWKKCLSLRPGWQPSEDLSFFFKIFFFLNVDYFSSLLNSLQYCFCIIFSFFLAKRHVGFLLPDQCSNPYLLLGRWRFNHWTTREVPGNPC